MVKGLSNKIVLFIVALLAIGGGSAYLIYDYLIPAREKGERELSDVRSAVQQKYDEVAKMKEEFVLLQSQLRDFKDLEARGFFNNQDRAEALDNFAKLSARVGLLKAKLQYASGEIVPNTMADDAKQVVVKSHGKVEIESLDDVDVYTLVKFMQERYPGSIDITKLELKRTDKLDTQSLRDIGSGKPLSLVKGMLEYDWRTMTARDTATPQSGGN